MASRLERLVGIDAYIRAGNYPSVEKLCQSFEVQPRTIYQDLRELREIFGLDIRFDRSRSGYYNATPSKTLPPLAMSYDEALLVNLAIEMLAGSLGDTFRGALARTVDMLIAHDEDQFSWLPGSVEFENRGACEVKCSVMVTVLKALAKNKEAVLEVSQSETQKVVVTPSKVFYSDGHWHLQVQQANKTVQFQLCKVSDVEIVGT